MTFPTTGILDNFNRTNQGPPPTGWTTIYNGHKVGGNLLIGNTSSDANVSAWNSGSYGPSLEVYVTLVSTSAIPTLYILDSTLDHGYSVVYNAGVVQIYRQDTFGSSETQLGADISQSFSNGDALGLEYVAATDTITAYRKPSGGSWASIGSRTDSTYTDMSRFALFSWSTASLDDFGGGTLVSAGAQTITPSGIASGGAFGTTVLQPGAVTVAPAGIASGATFGTATVSATASDQTIAPTGIASAEAFGTTAVQPGAVTIAPTGIASAEAFGTATLAVGTVTIAPTGIASAFAAGATQLLMAACIGGVLRQNTANGRYFENDAGPLVLTAFHTWYNTQDGDTTYPPDPFEWDDYLTRAVGHGITFTLLWRLESTRDWPSDNTQRFGVQPYARTGPGNAADGQPKFDLDTWDANYFDRLLQRAVTAGNAGLYVGVMLFQGFHIDNTKNGTPTGDPWAYHPFQNGNNINSVDGDIDNDGIGEELRDTAQTALYNRSKAFVEKVIDTLGHLDNVIWEIENEGGTYSVAWQHDLIDHIHTYEAGRPKQHPVGMVKIYPGGSNTDLTSSNADWISPDDDLAPDAVTSTAQVRAYDTDHSVGDTDTFDWVMRALTRGYGGIWYMDPWYGTSVGDTRDNATYELIRATLGRAQSYANRLDLENVTPQGSLSTTGYCIAKLTGVAQLLAYQDGSGAFDLTLTSVSGVFTVEWLRISTGTVQAGSNVTGGAVRTLTPPWSGEVVAFLELAELVIAPSGITSGEAFGTAVIQPGAIVIAPTGITSAEAFGSAAAQPGTVTVAPNGIASTEVFGTASTQPGGVIVSPSGVASGEAFGTALVQAGESYIVPTGIASAEAHGATTVQPGAVSILPAGIASGETHGETLLATGAVLQPASIASGEAHGSTTVQPGTITVLPDGIATAEAFGTASLLVDLLVAAAGIATGEAFGTALLSVGGAFIQPAGIDSGEAFGDLVALPGAVSILPASIAGGEAFGTLLLIVAGQDQVIAVPSVQAGETFGIATLLMALIAERTFSVQAEARRYVVAAENRIYSVTR